LLKQFIRGKYNLPPPILFLIAQKCQSGTCHIFPLDMSNYHLQQNNCISMQLYGLRSLLPKAIYVLQTRRVNQLQTNSVDESAMSSPS